MVGVSFSDWMFGFADRIVCATWDGVFGRAPGEGVVVPGAGVALD